MIKPSYVITLEVNGATESHIWNSEKPLEIGHPFRWVAERTEGGVRVRNVTSRTAAGSRELADTELKDGTSIELPESLKSKSSGFTMAIKPVISLPPAIKTHGDGAGEMRVYAMRGDWNISSTILEEDYNGYITGSRAFEIRKASAGKYKIRSLNDQIQFGNAMLAKGANIIVSDKELSGSAITAGEFKWTFGALKKVGLNPVPMMTSKAQDIETIAFRKSFKTACAAFAIFSLVALLWPKPDTQPPVPPQFTKMLFKKQKTYASAAAMGHADDISFGSTPMKHARGSSRKKMQVAKVVHKAPGNPKPAKAVAKAKSAPKKVAASKPKQSAPHIAQTTPKAKVAKVVSTKSALTSKLVARGPVHTVVQPSHEERNTQLAKTLADPGFVNASRGLVKSGMTKLMANKGYANGSDAKAEAKGMFKSGSSHGGSFGSADSLGSHSVQVASLGGAAGVFGGNGGVGYGRGSHASVSGQGKSFVALDTGKSEVEEGLTKEQVGAVIHAHMSEIRYCYESAQLRDPDLGGKLSVAFVVGAPGSVSSARLGQANGAEHALGECLVFRLKSWQFPQPRGGVNVAVNYPFIFKVLGR